jgi:hypothetical protein
MMSLFGYVLSGIMAKLLVEEKLSLVLGVVLNIL